VINFPVHFGVGFSREYKGLDLLEELRFVVL
jgi:hypothetical protein